MFFRSLFLILFSLLLFGCNNVVNREPDILYKTITTSKLTYIYEKAVFRSNRLGSIPEGQTISVLLEPKNRWLQIRTSSGLVGWIETRDVLTHSQYDEWQQLGKKIESLKPQAHGDTAEEANLRLRPGRESIKVLKLTGARPVEIFSVAHTIKPGTEPKEQKPEPPVKKPVVEKPKNPSSKKPKKKKPEGPVYETWYLVRTSDGIFGWLLSGLVNLTIPEDIARYAENKQVLSWHILSAAKDSNGQEHPTYLSLERDHGTNQDFDRVRVLYWNPARKRHELSYRIQNILGVLPVEVTRVDPGQPGFPRFKIHYLDEENPGEVIIEEYELNGVQVKKLNSIREKI
ncbi:MAG: SH3 domain-containing protein [Blastocatellia bacterium]|nr:SH3 domain-containing protein [Blastocatellia bacterium]